MARATRRTDPVLLLEVGMVLLLIGLAIVYFALPAADRSVAGAWWRIPLLVGLFFAVVGLHTWRRRRRGVFALRETIREGTGRAE